MFDIQELEHDSGVVFRECDCSDCREYRYTRFHQSNQFGR